VTALLGPSGCGKTTTLRMLAGLERPDAGSISINERVLNDDTTFVKPEHRRIGLVFQDYALFPHLTVAQNIAYGAKGEDTGGLLAELDLEACAARLPHELSGGQQQRVALARAMAGRPDVLLLDEPFSNLDTQLRHRVREQMAAQLRASGITTVLVTHDQAEALHLADEVAVMFDGRVAQLAAPRILYDQPVSTRVGSFVGEANVLPGTQSGFEVTCELGTLRAAVQRSGPVQVFLRPEALIVRPQKDGAGTVTQSDYFGHDQMVHIKMDSGTELRCSMPGAFPDIFRQHRVAIRVSRIVQTYPVSETSSSL